MYDGVGTLVGEPGAAASAPRIGVTVAEGTLVGLRGATESAALLSALGPRGVLEMSALGPCGTEDGGRVVRMAAAEGTLRGLNPSSGVISLLRRPAERKRSVSQGPCDSSTPRWGTAVDVPTVIVGEASSTPRWGTAVDVPTVAVGEGGSEGPSMEVDVPRWAVVR
jgi:hypothetical protein